MAATPPAERAQALKVSTLGRTDTPGRNTARNPWSISFQPFGLLYFLKKGIYLNEENDL